MQVTVDLQKNIKHKPVKVPHHSNPFLDTPDAEKVFHDQFVNACASDVIPKHFGVLPEEWDANEYPTHQSLKCGRKGDELVIELPESIWLPRAVAWAQGLFIMKELVYEAEDDE
jgi:hypothetical protein